MNIVLEEEKREAHTRHLKTLKTMDNHEASSPPPAARVWNDEVSAAATRNLGINR